jgi:predicted dehydrogenase
LEAVVICTPFTLNREIAMAAIAAGKHVLVEKPVATNTVEARDMVALEKKSTLVTMVAENWRYRPALLKMKQYLDEGYIGRPISVVSNIYSLLDIENKYFRESTWRLSSGLSSIMLIDCGVHFISGLRMLFGEIIEGISFLTYTFPNDKNLIDSMSFTCKFENGMHGLVNYHLNSIGYSQANLLVLGENGSMSIDEDYSKLTLYNRDNNMVEFFHDDTNGIKGEFENFFFAIRDGQICRSSFNNSYKDLETIEYAINSTRNWKHLRRSDT